MSVASGLLGVSVAGASYVGVTRGDVASFDRVVTAAFTANARSYDRLIAITSDFGSVYAIGGAAGTLYLTGRKSLARDVLVAGLAAWGLAQSVKPLVKRARPYTEDSAQRLVAIPQGSSWPSGHTAVATAMAATVAAQSGAIGQLLCGGYAIGVGVSRIKVGVHYASDIIAGAGVGLVAAAFVRGRVKKR